MQFAIVAALHCRPKELLGTILILLNRQVGWKDLVYNKHSGELAGFSNLGETNDQLLQFQRDLEGEKESNIPALAKTMFVIMVRGLFIRLNFPYAQFPCTTMMSGDLLFDLV